MPYNPLSPEAIAGERGERAADEFLRVHCGRARIMVSMLGSKAVYIDRNGKAHAAFDRLYFELGTRWCDIKWKEGPVYFQKLDVMRHGIDLPAWYNYVELVKLSKIPGEIAIVEIKRHRASDEIAPIRPALKVPGNPPVKGSSYSG